MHVAVAPARLSPPQARTSPVAEIETQTAPPARPSASNIEFQLLFEVQGNQRALHRLISKGETNWSVTAAPPDCSHGSSWGDTAPYLRVQSPKLTLANDGLAQVKDVIRRMAVGGAKAGKTGALRVTVPQNLLDDAAWTRFMRTFVAHEDILYRLSQMGGEGREFTHKMGYAAAPSSRIRDGKWPETVASWRGKLSGTHCGVHGATKGVWEFRFYDASTDVDAVTDNVSLLLGMLSAARDGRGQWNEKNPASKEPKVEVSRARWNAFFDTTVGDDGLKERSEQLFVGAGGRLEREPLSPAAQRAVGSLMARGYRFCVDDNAPAVSPDRLAEGLKGAGSVAVAAPGQHLLTLPASEVGSFAAVEAQDFGACKAVFRQRLEAANELQQRGFSFRDITKEAPLSPFHAALLCAEPGRVALMGPSPPAGGPQPSLPLTDAARDGAATMQQALAIEQGDTSNLPCDLERVLAWRSSRTGPDPSASANSNPSREHLLEWSDKFETDIQRDPTFPYQAQALAANQLFRHDIEHTGGSDALAIVTRAHLKQRCLTLAGAGAIVGGLAALAGACTCAPEWLIVAVPALVTGTTLALTGASARKREARLGRQLSIWNKPLPYHGPAIERAPAQLNRTGVAPLFSDIDSKIRSEMLPFAGPLLAANAAARSGLEAMPPDLNVKASAERLLQQTRATKTAICATAFTAAVVGGLAIALAPAFESAPMALAGLAGLSGGIAAAIYGSVRASKATSTTVHSLHAWDASLKQAQDANRYTDLAAIMPSLRRLGL